MGRSGACNEIGACARAEAGHISKGWEPTGGAERTLRAANERWGRGPTEQGSGT